ncbi:tRNA (guanosine(46)-N7)-methyltransferase TrmB [Spiroplasma eriocheiris]|uniref:tRNA (guanine-N(7)-)-methyltransferase n=1 Tax=Spiroplasma eriocheiris TaxID=315358 RepID=A0A0H3XNE3_9MOLU|nr:tRNA (guanosine(46)-N7)-methyltransferase TrmB [Spiroplasma eriocheiris]AHF58302.1 tRNA (guanine-N7-)-methyltransferase [Spiroplasma eriocheiris CCTCC M 207170]AKM54737.1 tRNA (guanine-N(7)-)-methyltransferase [Spiroplasma eriocheiris]
MRLRNKPWANEYLNEHPEFCILHPEQYQGHWTSEVFKNNKPLNIEIGTGKGDFIINLAKANPDQNYVGIEKYPSVLVIALKKLVAENLDNLKLLSYDAIKLKDIFGKNEVQKIYLNFSDPWPKKRHQNRRLTSKPFLALYQDILQNNGEIHFKTDNDHLFAFSLTTLQENHWNIIDYTNDLYNSKYLNNNIPTEYEKRFVAMNKNINYLYAKKSDKIIG